MRGKLCNHPPQHGDKSKETNRHDFTISPQQNYKKIEEFSVDLQWASKYRNFILSSNFCAQLETPFLCLASWNRLDVLEENFGSLIRHPLQLWPTQWQVCRFVWRADPPLLGLLNKSPEGSSCVNFDRVQNIFFPENVDGMWCSSFVFE